MEAITSFTIRKHRTDAGRSTVHWNIIDNNERLVGRAVSLSQAQQIVEYLSELIENFGNTKPTSELELTSRNLESVKEIEPDPEPIIEPTIVPTRNLRESIPMSTQNTFKKPIIEDDDFAADNAFGVRLKLKQPPRIRANDKDKEYIQSLKQTVADKLSRYDRLVEAMSKDFESLKEESRHVTQDAIESLKHLERLIK